MSTARVVRQGGATFVEEIFDPPTAGQTVFPLTLSYIGVGGFAEVIVNSATYILGVHFTMSLNQMTWIPAACFPIETSDVVVVRYQTP